MNIPEMMYAAFINQTGDISDIQYGRLPVPQPGPKDVLVRVLVSEVNHVDRLIFSGHYKTYLPMPFIIGRDLVGEVVATGNGISEFKTGDRVWCNSLGHHGLQGAWAEFAVVPEDRLYPLPDNANEKDVAALLHGASTACLGLLFHAGITPGDIIFIEGGGGAVGSAVIQTAHTMGAYIITSSAEDDAEWCLACLLI